jgi:uncharacterized protein (UPF0147 family)
MDFPTCPKGWTPLTMEEKIQRDKERLEKSVNTLFKMTEDELKWRNIRYIAARYHFTKTKQ